MSPDLCVGIVSGYPLSHAAFRIIDEFQAAACRTIIVGDCSEGSLCDVVLSRILGDEPNFPGLIVVLRQLEAQEQPLHILNRSAALLNGLSKLRQHDCFDSTGLPHVPTFPLSPNTVRKAISTLGFPVVTKPDMGMMGRLVELHTSSETVARLCNSASEAMVLQPYVPQGKETLRIVTFHDAILAEAIRVAAPADWRANVALGATIHRIEATNEERQLAIAATRACGLDIAGVDIVRTPMGPTLLELNPSPGLAGVERVCGNVARHLVRAIIADLRSNLPQHQARKNAR